MNVFELKCLWSWWLFPLYQELVELYRDHHFYIHWGASDSFVSWKKKKNIILPWKVKWLIFNSWFQVIIIIYIFNCIIEIYLGIIISPFEEGDFLGKCLKHNFYSKSLNYLCIFEFFSRPSAHFFSWFYFIK